MRTLTLVTICALAWPAVAAEPLPLQRYLHLVHAHHPQLAAARANVAGSRAAIRSAQAFPNPELEMVGGPVRPRGPGTPSGRHDSVTLAQPLEWPGVRLARSGVAEHASRSSYAGLVVAERDVRSAAKQAYLGVLRREEELRLAEENQQLLEAIRSRVRVRVEVGEAPRYELTKAEAEWLSAANSVAAARSRLHEARAQLRLPLGDVLPATVTVQPVNRVRVPEGAPALIDDHPLLQQATAERQRAVVATDLVRAQRLPQVRLIAGVTRDPETRQGVVGAAITLPLWDQRQGPIAEAEAERTRQEALWQQQQRLLQRDIEVTYQRYLIAQTQIQTFESGLLREAETALRVAEAAYRAGERGILDYLDAQRTLRQIRADFLNARFEKLTTLTELERLTGADYVGEA